MRAFFLLSFFFTFYSVFSQDSLKQTVIYFPVKNVIIYLDGHKIESSLKSILLEKGKHKVKVWAPHYKLIEDSFTVSKNRTVYSKRLHHTGAYKAFVARRWLRGTSAVVPAAFTVLYVRWMNNRVSDKSGIMIRQFNEKIWARQMLYIAPNNAIYLASYNKADKAYDEAKRDYERSKRNRIITGSVLGAASLAYIIFTCTHKLKFKEKPLLSRVTPLIDPLNNELCIRIRL